MPSLLWLLTHAGDASQSVKSQQVNKDDSKLLLLTVI